MSELADSNPIGRFKGLADLYARYRPGYAEEAIDYVVTRCSLNSQTLVADIGCGTGISTRLLGRRGVAMIGIDPNAEMLARAVAHKPADLPVVPIYCEGRAEATGLGDASVSAVLAAQAFHWFKPELAFAEFHRILKHGGWVILMWNERDETDPCTADYGVVVGGSPEAAAVEGPRGRAGEALLASALFQDGEKCVFCHRQELDEESLLGRAYSASYAPREPEPVARYSAALRDVFARHQQSGHLWLQYETSVFSARRQ